MRRLVLVLVLVLVGLFGPGLGCVTPSIPIPPPDPAMMQFAVGVDGEGVITSASLTYPPTESYKGGIAYVYNRSKGEGVIQDVRLDGSIGPTPHVRASGGDQLVVSVANDDQTVSTCILLREGAPTSYCP
jgi:hypothetical protein